ncbi:hypothetical protein R3P38DRAFT_2512262, partial [Favolaschia claudopus]
NMVKGMHTVLDVPTDSGKTLAFWWPLLYYWFPGNDLPRIQKNILGADDFRPAYNEPATLLKCMPTDTPLMQGL